MRERQTKDNLSKLFGEDKNNGKDNGKRVLIYIPSYDGKMEVSAVEGFFYLLFECWKYKKDGWQFFPVIGKRMFIQNARNMAVEHALKNNMDYILFIDDDMVIKPGDRIFTQLLKDNKDIVAPLFFQRMKPYLPLLFRRKSRADGRYNTYENVLNYEKGLQKVDGVGFGMVLIKTEVFKRMKSPYFVHGDTFGEDLYFCEKATSSGSEIYCDTRVQIGHIGNPEVSWESSFKTHEGAAKLYVKQKAEKDDAESAKMLKDVDIIMPCYHNFEITKTAIGSILNNTTGVKYNLILINDGGDRKLEKYFKTLEKYRDNITHITNKKNLGWIKAINQGLEKSSKPYVLFANNDIEVQASNPEWLYRLVESTYPDDIGAVGPVSNYVMGLQNIEYNKSILLPEHFTKILIGFCMLIKREVIDKVGGLDERFGIGGNDDLDYSIRIRKEGYKLKVKRDVFVRHEGTKSLSQVGDVTEIDNKTREILIDKWGKEEVDGLFQINNKFITSGE